MEEGPWMVGAMLFFWREEPSSIIKSVPQAIPLFTTSCFKLPRGVCQHINSLIRTGGQRTRPGGAAQLMMGFVE